MGGEVLWVSNMFSSWFVYQAGKLQSGCKGFILGMTDKEHHLQLKSVANQLVH